MQSIIFVVQKHYICTTDIIKNDMATVKATLRTTKKAGEAALRFRLSDGRNTQLFHKSGISVNIELWDEAKECIKAKKVCAPDYRANINKQVNDRKNLLLSVYEAHKEEIANSQDFEVFIDKALNPEKGNDKKRNFFEVLEEYIEKEIASHTETKCFRSMERTLYRYEAYQKATTQKAFTLSFATIDKETVEDIRDYFKNEYILVDEEPEIFAPILESYPMLANIQRKTPGIEERGGNTIIKMMKRFRAFYNWANREGITDKAPFNNVSIGSEVYGTPFYITMGERDTIAETDLSTSHELEAQRDIFVFQCFIGCRVGDLLKMTNNNVVGDFLEYFPHKTMKSTAKKISIPLHPKAQEILKKYHQEGDNAPILPFITAQKYNTAIKKVFQACGITRKVTILDPKTGEPISVPINEVASSHLARRTFVGNLYKQVKDPNLIGKLSGHSEGSRAFARYRDIDEEMKKELINLL